jgi:hypothetical protein
LAGAARLIFWQPATPAGKSEPHQGDAIQLESKTIDGHKLSVRLYRCELHEIEFSTFEELQKHIASSLLHRDLGRSERNAQRLIDDIDYDTKDRGGIFD